MTTEQTVTQWRLAEVQLLNWGTFDGMHRLPIARKGHLITGPSGSGKSSLLDGIATVLTPDRWLRFNDAAQGAAARANERGLVSYVRGAWSKAADDERDRVINQYLRERATFSGILLRYENGQGRHLTCARLFFLKGTSTDLSDLRDVCIIEREKRDLGEFVPYVRRGVEARKLKDAFPAATVSTNRTHAGFYTKLRSWLGISSDGALHLLHKTQSAKNLGSLDQLFRTFMLDQPGTFARVASAVEQFDELGRAHQLVVDTRAQRDALQVLDGFGQRYQTAKTASDKAHVLRLAIPGFEAEVGLSLARREQSDQRQRVNLVTDAAQQAAQEYRARVDELRLAEQTVGRVGGADVAQLGERIADARARAEDTRSRWQHLAEDLHAVGISDPPQTLAEFVELQESAQRELARPAAAEKNDFRVQEAFFTSKREVAEIDQQIDVLKHTRSNLSPTLQTRRAELAEHLGVTESALPFAGELIDVRDDYAGWTGAIERVLRPLATSLLVRDEHLNDVRRWIDERHLGARLVIEVVPREVDGPRKARSERSLVHRVQVRDGGFHDWISGRLSQRFDYACVDSADDLDRYEQAVTIHGQVKQSRTRYEKNDAVHIDDRRHWVLGGDNDAKLDALLARRADAARALAVAQKELDELQASQTAETRRRVILEGLRRHRWHDLDGVAADAEVARLEQQRRALTEHNTELDEATAAEERARGHEEEARAERDDTEQQRRQAEADLVEIDRAIEQYTADAGEVSAALDDETRGQLEALYRAKRRTLDRRALAVVGREVERQLDQDEKESLAVAESATQDFVGGAARFIAQWPVTASDLVATVDDRASFHALLAEIESRGLPEHEANFLRLLREKSSNVIGYLHREILDAPAEIAERIEPVNGSLATSLFDRDRFLRIRVKTRRSETVKRFLADLATIATGSWDDENLADAERRFAVLSEIMRRFASSERGDQKWREECLDTRRHVAFFAEVIDRAGRITATYDSGAALSGGQQQKLVIFCLAAALRYQLTDADDALPQYGSVILDEAFDKADSSYTRMAMDVFVQFGFHMILATPQKLLQTIEPYVGAVTAVANPSERASSLANVEYEKAP